ncbi:MAG: protease HtpX [Pseudobdellovibrio sp.]
MTYLKRFGYLILTSMLVALTVSFIVSLVTHFLRINMMGGGYAGLFIFCLLYGLAGSFISLQLSRWLAKKFHGVQVIDPQTTNPTERKLVDTVYRIARSAGMEVMPEVGFYESSEVNAFATGPSKSRALVAVSSGLMNTMTDAEIEGVLGHEITHVVNGDMVTLMLVQGVISAFAMFLSQIITMAIMSALRRNDDDDRRGFGDFMLRQLIYSLISTVFMILGSIVVNYVSRQREFRADAGSARITSQEKMSAALMRLQRVYSTEPAVVQGEDRPSDSLNTLKISGKSTGVMRLLMSHPPLEERLEALRNRTYAEI